MSHWLAFNEWLTGFVQWTAKFGLNYSFLLDAYQRGSMVDGALTTVWLCLFTIVGSLVAGVALAAMLTSGKPWLAKPARVFIEVTRNTPTLVQLYCAFLVLNMLLTQAVGTANPLTPFAWVVLVISLHKGAFHAEALRAGIEAVPAVTLEAASSLALSSRQLLWNVQLPLALRFALPSLINNLIDLVKMTAVASAIAVGDITYASIMIWTQSDNVLELMILLLAFFGLLSFVVNCVGRALEARLRMPGYGH
ncbi:amino acid ABC transporter permease [Pseudomonas sp. LS-2]|jgi:polar amino acid transport system permease protein|uniref:amino acid ABC transporter permease n=1 Tax=Pseudomonas sp. LS-2 TaxID=2315859 RepID=UPI000E759722|nr:amino acid ABC transporter permease [Pseudomonas sp. LS-2]RJX83592.1 amino acid ABC transporter permease [Pseudomonas sp. LS-2]